MNASKFLLQMLRFFYLIGILPHDFNKLLQIDPAVIVDVRLVEESLHLEVSNSATYTCRNVESNNVIMYKLNKHQRVNSATAEMQINRRNNE